MNETSSGQTATSDKTKNQRYITEPSSTTITDALVLFKNPSVTKPVTLIRAPIIFSRTSYSTPIALPIGLAYIAGVLEHAGYKAVIIDCPGNAIDNIQLTPDGNFHVQGQDVDRSIALIDPDTDIVGVSIMFSQEWPFVRDYINRVRKALPHVTIVIGGEHPTAMPEYSMNDCTAIDYIVMGEGELTFLELCHKLRTGADVTTIRSIAYRKNGNVIRSGQLTRLADIKKMPWPAWHLINLEPYFQPNFTMGISHGSNIAMIATRGCPYQCTFGSNPTMWTTRYTMRDVTDVVNEIEFYIKQYKINSIDYYDLTAVVKKEWILELIAELKKRNIKMVWQLPSGTRSESLDDEVLTGLKDTGCEFVVYAPESGSQRTLDMIKKRVSLEKLEKSVTTAINKGLIVKINFIIGFPFEDRIDILKTLLFAWKLALLKAQDCNISPFSPYPGSELFTELEKEGRFGKIDDYYFKSLITQFDLTIPSSFCKKVSGFELMTYRMVGFAVFYTLSYLRSPSKIIRLYKMWFNNEPFKAHSLFEQRMFDIKARRT